MSGRLNGVRVWGHAFQPPVAAEHAARIDVPPARHSAADSVRRSTRSNSCEGHHNVSWKAAEGSKL
jgi:hypothetical protein